MKKTLPSSPFPLSTSFGRAGDILIFCRVWPKGFRGWISKMKHFTSWRIQRDTGSIANHVGLLLVKDGLYSPHFSLLTSYLSKRVISDLHAGKAYVIEALASGVTVRPIETYLEQRAHIIISREPWPEVTNQDRYLAILYAVSQLGEAYDFWKIVRFRWRLFKNPVRFLQKVSSAQSMKSVDQPEPMLTLLEHDPRAWICTSLAWLTWRYAFARSETPDRSILSRKVYYNLFISPGELLSERDCLRTTFIRNYSEAVAHWMEEESASNG